jgi:hypothetical protein
MSYLRQAWELWKRLGRLMGDLLGRVVLTVFYFTIFVPFAAIARVFTDPLQLKPAQRTSFWLAHETQDPTLDEARGQF